MNENTDYSDPGKIGTEYETPDSSLAQALSDYYERQSRRYGLKLSEKEAFV